MKFGYSSVRKLREDAIRESIETHTQLRKPKIHNNDPFEIYHYEDTRSDDKVLADIEKNVKRRVNEQVNIAEMKKIQQKLLVTKHMLQQEINAQEAEMQSLQIVVRRLENQHRHEELVKMQPIKSISKVSASQQTQHPKFREIGTFTMTQDIDKQKTHPKLIQEAYSIKIQQDPRPAQKQDITIADGKKDINYQRLNQTNLNHQRNLTVPEESQAKSIYRALQAEMAYLKHLKQLKAQNRDYNNQKRKVKIMMQLFWKSALPYAPSDEDCVELRELEEFDA